MSAAVASQRGSGCCDGTPAAGNGTRTDRERSREQGGVRVAGGGAERTGLLAVEKLEQLVHAIPRGLHVAAHSVTVAPRRDQLCRGCPSGPFFRTSFFFIRQRTKALSPLSYFCPSSISAPSRTMSFGALPGAPPLPAAAHPMSTHDALMRPLMCGQCGRTAPHQRCILQLSSVRATFRA